MFAYVQNRVPQKRNGVNHWFFCSF
jgi:hypothetical protein